MRAIWLVLGAALVMESQQAPFQVAGTLSVTASGGDGSTCAGTKVAGAVPALSVTCKGASGATAFAGTISGTGVISFNDVSCLFGVNATAAPVTIGPLGAVPGSSVGYQCSVNLRAAGPATPVTGTVMATQGAVTFP